MPKDNIERAIKRGTGELEGEIIEELIYEGIGPNKSQFIVKCLTGSKNRSAAAVRHIFTKYGGSLGSVSWNFEKKGIIRIANDELEKAPLIKGVGGIDNFELELIDMGVEDILKEEEGITIYARIEDLQKIKQYLDSKNISVESAEIEYVAKEKTEIPGEKKEQLKKFIEELEDDEDVADYYTNIINI